MKQLGLVNRRESKVEIEAIKAHKTFADDEDRYWRLMKESNEPMTKVLIEMSSVLKELRDLAIREEGRREVEKR